MCPSQALSDAAKKQRAWKATTHEQKAGPIKVKGNDKTPLYNKYGERLYSSENQRSGITGLVRLGYHNSTSEGLSNSAFLKLPNGVEWKVELTESDGEVWLQKGWLEFAKYYSVKQGHFLVFRYEGNSHFYVLIFDESATEIDYHFNTSHGGKGKLHNEFIAPNMEEIESYSDIEFLGSFPPSPKTRDKSPLSYFRPHKIMKTNSSAKGVKGISTTKQRLKSKAVRMIQPLNNNETARALQRASAFKPKNPYFKVVMQPSCLDRNLIIPKDFVKKYSNILHGDVNLWVSDGSNWPIEFRKRTDENLICS
ncbi:hypothetical protein SO802_008438 [Lithocarpus litseifolius]|uniref:TF-B3 domain-containing protein n=1 Tax=Lithocarpus litseifolius TaxID=425828 RepID=A0AAW2DE66_9ROSI